MVNLIHWTLPYLFAILLLGVWGLTKKSVFSYIIGVVVLWTGTFTVFGFGVSAEKLSLCLFFAYIILNRVLNGGPRLPFLSLYMLTLVYFLLHSVVRSFQVPPNELEALMPTALQTPPLRGILSTLLFCVGASLIYFPFSVYKPRSELETILRVMFGSALVVMVVLVIQLGVRSLVPSLSSFFSVVSSDSLKVLMDTSPGVLDFRPSLFSSEPKYFGLAFANLAAFAILQRTVKLFYLPNWTSSAIFIGSCLTCLVLSSSVAAASSFLLGAFAMLYFVESSNGRVAHTLRVIFWVMIFAFSAGLLLLVDSDFVQRFELYLRLAEAGFDGSSNSANLSTTAYLLWMFDEPSEFFFGVGIGNGAFYAYDYVSTTSGFFETGFSSSRVPIIDLVAGVGVGGALLLYFTWFHFLNYIRLFAKGLASDQAKELVFLRGCIIYYISSGLIYNTNMYVWLFFGLAFSRIAYHARVGAYSK